VKRGAVIGIVAGGAVLLAVGGVVAWSLVRPPSIEDAAAAYLDALTTGDFAAIDPLLGPEVASENRRILEDAFAAADSYISDARIEEISPAAGGLMSVRASAMLDGERRGVFFSMADGAGRWALSGDYLATIFTTTALDGDELPAGDSVWIGDALAPAGTPVGVLPAVYTVSAAPRGLLDGAETTAASNDRAAEVAIRVSVAPETAATAQEQLDVYAEDCAEPATTVPENCGIRVPWAADLTALASIAFRIEQLPTVEMGADGRTFAATDGVIIATASGTARTGGAGTFTYRSDAWTLRGSVSFEGDEMILAVG
jgi:hypothetical protein